ncbi:hypothetical protein BDV06DRAFT_56783 [Aspergillus oleicola]
MHLLSLLATALTLTAGLTSAMPSEAKTQISCIGVRTTSFRCFPLSSRKEIMWLMVCFWMREQLNNRRCDNSTINFTCCPPLTCGSDARCH